MRAVLQRAKRAQVRVDGVVCGSIGKGLVVLIAIGREDGDEDINYMVSKILNLRIFEDDQGKMNLSLRDISGELLVVSQFTLYGDCRKGRRPNFFDAAPPDQALLMYRRFIDAIRKEGINPQEGEFQKMMELEIVNDGPVTILLDSKKVF
ncbi:MAG: D-aminoacyl-tRNA deacylase [Candidatus Aenigmatarchaeota archaeon]